MRNEVIRTEPNPDRSQLRFEETVLSAFAFLTVPPYGFKCEASEVTLVRYESANVFVNIYHGRSSYEIGCEIGLIPERDGIAPGHESEGEDPEEGFTIWEIARFEGAPGIDDRTFLQASTAERVEQLVPQLAQLVRTCASRALRGDLAYYTSLGQARTNWFENYMTDSRLERARADVARAWQTKNYAEVVRLFEPLTEELTPAESKKLEYARKHSTPSR